MNFLFHKPALHYKINLGCILFLAWSLTSCVKGVTTPTSPSTNPPASEPAAQGLRGTVASDNFSWLTVKSITINVVPMPMTSNEKQTLEIRTSNDELVFTYNMAMHKSLTEKIVVPANATSIKMKYGRIEKSIDIVNNLASLDFSQPIPDQYK